jgi:hypothetical protein
VKAGENLAGFPRLVRACTRRTPIYGNGFTRLHTPGGALRTSGILDRDVMAPLQMPVVADRGIFLAARDKFLAQDHRFRRLKRCHIGAIRATIALQ